MLSRKFLGYHKLYTSVFCKSRFAKDTDIVSMNIFHFCVPSLIIIWIS